MTSVSYFTVSGFVADFITGFDNVRKGGGADVFEEGGAGAGSADMTDPGGADVFEPGDTDAVRDWKCKRSIGGGKCRCAGGP